MAGEEHAPPIESRTDLIEVLATGGKPRAEWRVGTEHEKHVFHRNPLRPVAYEGEHGVRALLEGIEARTRWHPFFDLDKPIGLRNHGDIGGISLEPGGQFELSGAPQLTVQDSAAELASHLADCHAVGDALDINFLGLGVTPLWQVSEIPSMPKSRYAIMTRYMGKVGKLGTSMMYRSATAQTNLDFADEADMVRKLRVSLALQPVVTALFANSPFVNGKPSGFLSFRSEIWRDTDAARTGMLPFAFEDGFGFERYVDYALDVPMYFVIRNNEYIDVAGEDFRAFLAGKLPQLPGQKPTIKDWENHLSTLFPEVRLKQFLEMRGADMGDIPHVNALTALWVGLLYDEVALDAAGELIKDWSVEEQATLRRDVPRTAIHTPFRHGTVADVARQVVGIARGGLERRGHDEAGYLAPLAETLDLGKTQAERWLDKYHGEWAGDLTRIFEAARL